MKTVALSIVAAALLAGAANAAPANAPRPKDLTSPPPPKTGEPAPDKIGVPPTPPVPHLLPAIQTVRDPIPPRPPAGFKDSVRTARELGSRATDDQR